jgi:hypothetical protein
LPEEIPLYMAFYHLSNVLVQCQLGGIRVYLFENTIGWLNGF